MTKKKVLILGAGGAMGRYIVPVLSRMGFQVDGLVLDDCTSTDPNVRYFKCDAMDPAVRAEFLKAGYDGIIDFMIYNTSALMKYLPRFADSTDHYIYLSSYRVYDNKEIPVRETSPRLLDTADDPAIRSSDDYSVYKARGENIIRALFPRKNWTIVRPAVTYSLMRYQLTVLEAPYTVGRALAGKKVVLPEQTREIQATMTWGGDAAMMIASLLFNEKALGEAFSVCTSEHHTWGTIADYYREICGLETVWTDKEEFLRILCPDPAAAYPYRWQLECDRMFSRVMDNSKVLAVTGLKQENFKTLFDGLQYEIGRCPKDYRPADDGIQRRMDDFLAKA